MKQTIRIAGLAIGASSLLALWTVVTHSDSGGFGPNLVAAPAPNAQQNSFEQPHGKTCSLRTMEGTHGYSYSGTVFGNPIAAAGPITFDGEGNLSAKYTVSVGGITHQGAFTGTYTVNPDCTGTATLNLPLLGITTSGTFVIVSDGQETFFVGTDPEVTVNGITKRQ